MRVACVCAPLTRKAVPAVSVHSTGQHDIHVRLYAGAEWMRRFISKGAWTCPYAHATAWCDGHKAPAERP